MLKKKNYGVYNIGSEIGIQIKQILQYIFESDEVLNKVISNNSAILNQTLNTTKLRLEIGQRKKMFHDEVVREIKRINFE